MTSEVEIFPAFQPPASPTTGKKYFALYDTGATHSSVSPRVVSDLQLASIGARNVGVGGGTLETTSHLVNIALPNRVMFGMMPVASIALHGGVDVLIGMDLLGLGDFAVTHNEGNTTFTFCSPSRKEIDFVAEVADSYKVEPSQSNKVGRNTACPCGSGKKYKKCHGA